ncbi:MAG: hypothetical protein ACI8QZ_001027 [Chlamydiales bacterium]|jgi:hypothetical protein
MRMLYYFAALGALIIPGLLATAALGLGGRAELHLKVGLISAICTVGLHTLVILFMIVTGRVLREAMRTRDFPKEFLEELNDFFSKKAAYPAAVFGALSIVFAGVAGYAVPSLGLPLWIHPLVGAMAVLFNFWVMLVEFAALRANKGLIDRAALMLDQIDIELAAKGELPVDDDAFDATHMLRGGMILAISAWLPYLYWGMIEWQGDFSRVSIHPWLEASLLGLLVWFLARREKAGQAHPG